MSVSGVVKVRFTGSPRNGPSFAQKPATPPFFRAAFTVFLSFFVVFCAGANISNSRFYIVQKAGAGSVLPPPTVGATPSYANSPTAGSSGSGGNGVQYDGVYCTGASTGGSGDTGPTVSTTVTPPTNGGGDSNIANVISNGGNGGSGGNNNTGVCLNNASSGGSGGQGGSVSITVNAGSGTQS